MVFRMFSLLFFLCVSFVFSEGASPGGASAPGPVLPREAGKAPPAHPWNQTSAEAAFALTLEDREEVRQFYQRVYFASRGVPMEWTGDYGNLTAGTTSAAWQESTRLRINFFRAMAGVPANITFDPELAAKCQEAALIMSLNNMLSHDVPPNWTGYTEDGAEAANKSNIALGTAGAESVTGYIRDSGQNNDRVGHRRWKLYPPNTTMAAGDVPGDDTYRKANAIWVIADQFGARPQTREPFVAWPPPGYVPAPLVYARWSFSSPDADFRNATVTMKRGEESLPVELEDLSPQNPQSGSKIGDNTIVWIADGLNPNFSDGGFTPPEDWPIPEEDETIEVTVANVLMNGESRDFTYEVTVFDPDEPTPGTPEPTLSVSGPIGQAGQAFDFQSVSFGQGLQFRQLTGDPVTWLDSADNGTERFIVQVPQVDNVVQTARTASPPNAFYLPANGQDDRYLQIRGDFLVGESAELAFLHSLSANFSVLPRIEVSLNDGESWTPVWRDQRQLSSFSSDFESIQVDLSDLIGRTIQIRFGMIHSEGSFNTSSDPDWGWALDDISLSGVLEVKDVTEAVDTPGPVVVLDPTEVEGDFLQARQRVFGRFFLDWSPAHPISEDPGFEHSLPAGATTSFQNLGRTYAANPEWGYSETLGFAWISHFPWIFHSDLGWLRVVGGSADSGLWLKHESLGWIYTRADWAGFFYHEPFGPVDTGRFR